jgi:hypothetical protein
MAVTLQLVKQWLEVLVRLDSRRLLARPNFTSGGQRTFKRSTKPNGQETHLPTADESIIVSLQFIFVHGVIITGAAPGDQDPSASRSQLKWQIVER